jgi:predicted O-methyltransferase YrrM
MAVSVAPDDLSDLDPIPAIMATPEFSQTVRAFADNPSIKSALISPDSQALLYSLIRLLRPEVVIEIGTYMASTTEAMARAISDNGFGALHTIDPYGAEMSPQIIARWPRALQATTKLHLTDSMLFFAWMQKHQLRTDLVFVDGNHDYEYALFDIQSAARAMNPGGFIVVDNIAQPGPFFAAQDFMEKASAKGWHECGNSLNRFRPTDPFDRHRTTIHNTDFCILRAPTSIAIANRPVNFGELPWTNESSRLRLIPAADAIGRLQVQFVIRIFEQPPREIIQSTSTHYNLDRQIDVNIVFPKTSDKTARRTIEPWLAWEGATDLLLKELPKIC